MVKQVRFRTRAAYLYLLSVFSIKIFRLGYPPTFKLYGWLYLGITRFLSHILLNCVNGSLYKRSDRPLKADRLIIIDNNPLGLDALWCYREAKITRFHSLEMDAKNNDPNEPEQKKIPLTRRAYHLKENFGNSWWKVPCEQWFLQTGSPAWRNHYSQGRWKVNGKVTFRKFQPKIEKYVLR